MKITRENYELFFIDYLDGTLSDAQIIELEDFLLINQDLREELEGMEKTILVPENYSFKEKEFLYRIDTESPLTGENLDDYYVAYIEGDLDHKKTSDLLSYIGSNPAGKKELDKYYKTKLSYDESLIFKGKSSLRRKNPAIRRLFTYSVISSAAALALFVIILRNTGHQVNEDHQNITHETEVGDILKEKSILPVEAQESIASKDLLPDEQKSIDVVSETGPLLSFAENSNVRQEDASDFTATQHKLILLSSVAKNLPSIDPEGSIPDKVHSLGHQEFTSSVPVAGAESASSDLSDIAIIYLNKKLFKKNDSISETSTISFWDVAHAGIQGLNRLTGYDVQLDKQLNNDGEIMAISFDAGFFGFTRIVK